MKLLAAAFVSTLALASTAANAADIVGLYDTGVDGSGNKLANGASDTHYLLNGSASPVVYTNAAYVTSPDAMFIGVQANGGYTNPTNVYTLTFNVDAAEVSTAQLSGEFAADNLGTVTLNGNQLISLTGGAHSNYNTLHAFSAAAADFVAGANTLTFTITDLGPPSAFMVTDLSGTVTGSAVPEPGAWSMLFAGFFGLGAMARLGRRNLLLRST